MEDVNNPSAVPVPNPSPQAPNITVVAAPQANPPLDGSVQNSGKKGFGKIIKILIPVIILIAFGIIAFFVVDKLNTPAKVKEKASINQPIFLSLEKTNKKIVAHLKEDSGSDSDALERYSQKGEDLSNSAKKDKNQLSENMQTLSVGALGEYKSSINEYLAETEKLIALEDENVRIGRAYVKPIEEYQKLTVEISGASSLIYTDPDAYLKALDNAVTTEEKIIADLKKLTVSSDYKDLHESFISTFEAEAKFLNQLKDAVSSRNATKIAAAEKEFTETSQDSTKERSRLNDELKDKIDKISDEMDLKSDKIKESYSSLKGKYNF